MEPAISIDCSTRRGSVVPREGLKYDSFELGECVAAETKCRLEALDSELAGVERAPQFVECRSLAVEYLLARSLEQDQVSRAAKAVREPHVPFALQSVESLEGQNNALLGLQALQDSAGEQLVGAFLDLALCDPTGEERSHPAGGERRPALLHDSLGEPCGLRRLGADDDEKAPGRVAQPMRRSQNPAPD